MSYRRPPKVTSYDWYGEDRRANDALSQLVRSLYPRAQEAADALELSTELERLGFTHKRVKQTFGMESVFDLASYIYSRVARKPADPLRHTSRLGFLPFRQLCLGIAALITAFLGAEGQLNNVSVIWLLAWGMAGTYVLEHKAASLQTAKGTLAVVVLGLLGLVFSWLMATIGFTDIVLGLLWWSLAAHLWLHKLSAHSGVWAVATLAAAASSSFMPFIGLGLLLILSLTPFIPFLMVGEGEGALNAGLTISLTIYALALAYFIVQVFERYNSEAMWGSLVLVAVSFGMVWLNVWLRRVLRHALWQSQNTETYMQAIWRGSSLLPRVFLIVASLVIFYFLQTEGESLGRHLAVYALLGINLGLSLTLVHLGNLLTPGALFVLACIGLWLGLPMLWLLIGLWLALVVATVLELRDVESYSMSLL